MRREMRECHGRYRQYHEFGSLSFPLEEAQEFGDPVRCLGYNYQGGAYHDFTTSRVRIQIELRLEYVCDVVCVYAEALSGLFAPLFAYRADAADEFIQTIDGTQQVGFAKIEFAFKAPYAGIENLREEFELALKIIERRLERHIRETAAKMAPASTAR